MSNIEEIKGNLFDADTQVIVNTVNCKGVMGKGIALEFRFPKMFEQYVSECEKEKIKPGVLTLWKKSTPWILNFPTKMDWKHPSKMDYIIKGLINFKDNYHKWGITSIAFPGLGTNHGGLSVAEVKKVMYEHLEELKIPIKIYQYDPSATDQLFQKLKTKLDNCSEEEIINKVGIKKKAAGIVN